MMNSSVYAGEYCDEAYSYQEFLEIVKNHEFQTASKFIVYKNTKGFLDEKLEISAATHLEWRGGLPYFHFGTRVYSCHQGKDTNITQKRRQKEQREIKAKSQNMLVKWNKWAQPTKKVGCPVLFKVVRGYAMPQFQIEHPTDGKKRTIREKVKSLLMDGEAPSGKEILWFSLPPAEAHQNHMTENEPIDPILRMKIKEYVQEGNTKNTDVLELLKVFAATELQQFDETRKRFYPNLRTVTSLIKEAKKELKPRFLYSIHSSISIEPTSVHTSFEQESTIQSIAPNSEQTSSIQDSAIYSIEPTLEHASFEQNNSNQSIESTSQQMSNEQDSSNQFIEPTSFEQDSFIQSIEISSEQTSFKQEYSIQSIESISQPTIKKSRMSASYSELKKKGNSRKNLIKVCNGHCGKLKSMFNMLPEAALEKLEGDLAQLAESYISIVDSFPSD